MAEIIKDFVIESATTTGTGNFSLSGTVYGLRTFGSVCSVGDTFRYIIKSVDAGGNPTGEFEVGIGTYSAANTLQRDTVIDSSNAGALVNFSAGTKHVYMGVDATKYSAVRELLKADRTYYVRTDGSDSNSGLVNSSSGAFLTIQKAVDVVSGTIDNGGYTVTIRVVAGTYTGAVTLKPVVGAGITAIRGDTADLTSTVISTTSNNCFTGQTGGGGCYTLEYLKMQTTTSGNCIHLTRGWTLRFKNVAFGACATTHIFCQDDGYAEATGNYSINGNASTHITSQFGSEVAMASITVTLSGTPAFSSAFCVVQYFSLMRISAMTFSGSATGQRYGCYGNSVIYTGSGGSATYLPGNSNGSALTGGQYI